MNIQQEALLVLGFTSILGGFSALVFQLATTPTAPRPILGARGLNRARALQRRGPFDVTGPLVRLLAAWVAILPIERTRKSLRSTLLHAGDYLGLSADELIALCVLAGLGLGLVTLPVCELLTLPRPLAVAAFFLGVSAPWVRVLAVSRSRARSVGRALPGAVDLAAMCMSAGLDFPGSLRRIVESAAEPSDPIIEEFTRVLQELDLGHTRKNALLGFAARVPTDQVREFVNSVVQAEDKGSPLASVLTIQAQTQRLRRSIAAEETASEAALMLLGPMTLIFLCVIVLLLGPVAVRFMTGGLGPT